MKDELSTRDRIIRAADDLFYRRGFEATSFTDIAEVVEISRGNFYHHFKSKDDILDAVVQSRLAGTRQMLERWDAEGEGPLERVRLFVDILIRNRSLIVQYGCPVGTLCTELAKIDHPALPAANRLFTLFRTWLRRQFEHLGRREEADVLAMRLLARTQGAATLASAFHDEQFLRREASEMYAGLDACLIEKAPARSPTGRGRAKLRHF